MSKRRFNERFKSRLNQLGKDGLRMAGRGLLSLVLVWVVTESVAVAGAGGQQKRPNILLVVVDDMGYSDLGAYGGEIRTPNLDRLARSGLMFTDFYVGPTCSPTRSMLMSGNDNHIAGLGNMNEALLPNQVGQPGYEGYLNDRVVSVASLLRDAGYHTYMSGKWHLGEEPEHDPSKRGFEKSFTMLQGGTSHFDDEWMMYVNYTPTYRENGVRTHVPRGFYSTEFYTDKIIEYIDQREDGRPFFAYLSYTAVHDPLHVPDDWLDKYKGAYDAGYDALREQRLGRMKRLGIVPQETKLAPRLPMVPAWDELNAEQKARQARKMELYAAMVENMDFHVGRLVAYLKEGGLYDNTVILFLSDNGANGAEMHQYPGTDEAWIERNSDNRFENWGRQFSRIAQGPGWAQASVTPFRLFKAFNAEGGIRSPLIVHGPGMARAGQKVGAVAHVMDIAPTLLDIAGSSYPSRYGDRQIAPPRGRSIIPLISGQRDFVRAQDEPLCWELFGWRAVRLGNWKATWIVRPFGASDWQLFNLAMDPGETNDLAEERPRKLGQLVDEWDAYADEVEVILPEEGGWPGS
jgi:arylsulfatase